jgi:glycosyltransferase involved in cell wall biosynthesis
MQTVSSSLVTNSHDSKAVPSGSGDRRRVFFLVDSLEIGGTETQAVELALRLDQARYTVTLGCLRMAGPLLAKLKGSTVTVMEWSARGGVNSPRGVYQILRLARFLHRGCFDVVHAHDLWSNLLAIPAARLARVPVIISSRRDLAHLAWYTPGRRKFLRHLQSLSSAVLVNSSQISEHLVREDGFRPEFIRVVHNGIDLDRFSRLVPERERLFPGLDNLTLIVCTGNMHSDIKGHPTLIEAARHICAKFPQIKFVLIGDGEKRSKFESKVLELGLQRNFLFLGSRQNVPEILACCDMAILPSQAEGFSNALLEYMAVGLPTVATDVGGNSEVVENRVNGLLVKPNDPAALADAISSLLENPHFASQLGAAARERVRRHFDFARLTFDVDALYTDLLQARGSGAPKTAN